MAYASTRSGELQFAVDALMVQPGIAQSRGGFPDGHVVPGSAAREGTLKADRRWRFQASTVADVALVPTPQIVSSVRAANSSVGTCSRKFNGAEMQDLHLKCGICRGHKLLIPRKRPHATVATNVPTLIGRKLCGRQN